jgi:hypothetical protein
MVEVLTVRVKEYLTVEVLSLVYTVVRPTVRPNCKVANSNSLRFLLPQQQKNAGVLQL